MNSITRPRYHELPFRLLSFLLRIVFLAWLQAWLLYDSSMVRLMVFILRYFFYAGLSVYFLVGGTLCAHFFCGVFVIPGVVKSFYI